MRMLLVASTFLMLLAAPLSAHAGFGVEGSVGKGVALDPTKAQPTNLMVAPGYGFLFLRLQLGVAADLPDVEASKFDLGLRPMLTLSPPILPLYARLVLAWNNLFHDSTVAYGGALGFGLSFAGIGVFAEAGVLPRDYQDKLQWVIEGRAGVSLGF
jgi:hypothetical protein